MTNLDDHVTLPTSSVSFSKLRYHDNLPILFDTLNASLSLSQNSVVICLRHAHKLKLKKKNPSQGYWGFVINSEQWNQTKFDLLKATVLLSDSQSWSSLVTWQSSTRVFMTPLWRIFFRVGSTPKLSPKCSVRGSSPGTTISTEPLRITHQESSCKVIV